MSLQIDFQKSAQNHQIVTHTAVHTVPWYLNKKKNKSSMSAFLMVKENEFPALFIRGE